MKKKYIPLILSALMVSCNSTFIDSQKSSENLDNSESVLTSLDTESEVVETSSIDSDNSEEFSVVEESNTVIELSSSEETSSIEESSSQEEEILYPKSKNITNYLGSDNDIYRINITTENETFPTNKTDYVPGNLNITEQDTNKVLFEGAKMGIRLRGNSTLDAKKKAFRVKFDKKQSLFGLTKAKSWVLLANYFDKSNVRNYLAYLTANKLSNLNFQPSSIFVDVYFNNQYYGLFLLCEQMEAKEGRVDITSSVSEDGVDSFFIEADARAKDEYPGQDNICYLDSFGYTFAMKYPDCDDYLEALENLSSQDQSIHDEAQAFKNQYNKDISWLRIFLDNISNSITNLNNYEQYIDVDSFIDYYLLEELFKNVDVGSTSQYYYIDQKNQKLTAGPVWDFDIGAGAIGEINGKNDTYRGYIDQATFVANRDYYINKLLKDSNFKNKVKARYSEIRDDLYTVFDELDVIKTNLDKAQARNLERWPFSTERQVWIEQYALSDYFLAITSINEHYTYLSSYLSQRFDLLDAVYGSN